MNLNLKSKLLFKFLFLSKIFNARASRAHNLGAMTRVLDFKTEHAQYLKSSPSQFLKYIHVFEIRKKLKIKQKFPLFLWAELQARRDGS